MHERDNENMDSNNSASLLHHVDVKHCCLCAGGGGDNGVSVCIGGGKGNPTLCSSPSLEVLLQYNAYCLLQLS